MASERDREIWDDATNAVCQAMQEQKMCNCPDGDCLAAKIDFSPEKIATATRPAPAATDTGLVTVEYQVRSKLNGHWVKDNFLSQQLSPDTERRELVTRSQAEELLAAERAEKEEARRAEEEAKDCFWSIYETYLEKGGLPVSTEGARSALSNRIASLEADNAAKDADIAELVHDLNRIKDHETELFNDNAAKDARVKELEELLRISESCNHFADNLSKEMRVLEAKLAAAEKALEPFADHAKERAVDAPEWRDTDTVQIVVTIGDLRAARAVLGGKP